MCSNSPFGPKKTDGVHLQYLLAIAPHRLNLEKPIWSKGQLVLGLNAERTRPIRPMLLVGGELR